MTTTYQINVNSGWVDVSVYIFRSWTGGRRTVERRDGGDVARPYGGPVFVLGTTQRAR